MLIGQTTRKCRNRF